MTDFFKPECQRETEEPQFGIRDGINNNPAFIMNDKSDEWVAHVDNSNTLKILFHAIDDCVEIVRDDGKDEKRCDAMLTYEDNIVFIELKEVRTAGWIQGGIEQLETFILIFKENYDLAMFKKKRAFLANRRHPTFKFSHKEDMEKFKAKTTVRLIIYNKIKI